MRFPGRDLVFVVLVGSLMIPNAVVLVPQYVLTQRLGWLSSYQGLIVPEAATTFAFGVFLLRQFFVTMPGDLEDAARIDGANAWQVFWRIVLPLSQPVLAALAIFTFRSAWNDFLWPLIAVNKPDMFPSPSRSRCCAAPTPPSPTAPSWPAPSSAPFPCSWSSSSPTAALSKACGSAA